MARRRLAEVEVAKSPAFSVCLFSRMISEELSTRIVGVSGRGGSRAKERISCGGGSGHGWDSGSV